MLTNSKKRKLYHFSNLINDFIFNDCYKFNYINKLNNTIYEGVLYKIEKFSNFQRVDTQNDYIKKKNEIFLNYDNTQLLTAQTEYAPEIKNDCLFVSDKIIGHFVKFDIIKNYSVFDRFDFSLSDKQFKKMYMQAQKLYNTFTKTNDFKKESCFISSNSLHGFYFPNNEKIACIAFLDKIPYILYHAAKNEK